MVDKSRDIPITDLFYYLQLEWVSYYVRSKIYEREIDIKRFNDICRMKKDKIDTFSLRNSVPSIFKKDDRMQKYIDLFYPQDNLPKFQYTPKNKENLTIWDKYYFYRSGTVVEFEGRDVTILKNDNLINKVEFIDDKRNFIIAPYSEIRRDISIIFDI